MMRRFPMATGKSQRCCRIWSNLFGGLIEQWKPEIVVIACNTASTLAIERLRETYPDQTFVGTVPAIKPAAERTRSGLVSVLATPGTVRRQYTRDLISDWASKVEVTSGGQYRACGPGGNLHARRSGR